MGKPDYRTFFAAACGAVHFSQERWARRAPFAKVTVACTGGWAA